MAKLRPSQIIHSDDACKIKLFGDRRSPEPSSVIIETPHAHVEVARRTDGSYWFHVRIDTGEEIEAPLGSVVASRLDYFHGATKTVADLPEPDLIQGLSICIGAKK